VGLRILSEKVQVARVVLAPINPLILLLLPQLGVEELIP
jgi:hypothetical protein